MAGRTSRSNKDEQGVAVVSRHDEQEIEASDAVGDPLHEPGADQGIAVAVLFFVESIGTRRGMGYYIIDAWGRAAYPEMFAGIIALSLIVIAVPVAEENSTMPLMSVVCAPGTVLTGAVLTSPTSIAFLNRAEAHLGHDLT